MHVANGHAHEWITVVSSQVLQSAIKSSQRTSSSCSMFTMLHNMQTLYMLPCKPEGYMPHAMQARKATCLLPCKPEGYMSHEMQARRLHVSCHASQNATCLIVADHLAKMSTSWQTCQHMTLHTLQHRKKTQQVLHTVLGTNLEQLMLEQVSTSKACANPRE